MRIKLSDKIMVDATLCFMGGVVSYVIYYCFYYLFGHTTILAFVSGAIACLFVTVINYFALGKTKEEDSSDTGI